MALYLYVLLSTRGILNQVTIELLESVNGRGGYERMKFALSCDQCLSVLPQIRNFWSRSIVNIGNCALHTLPLIESIDCVSFSYLRGRDWCRISFRRSELAAPKELWGVPDSVFANHCTFRDRCNAVALVRIIMNLAIKRTWKPPRHQLQAVKGREIVGTWHCKKVSVWGRSRRSGSRRSSSRVSQDFQEKGRREPWLWFDWSHSTRDYQWAKEVELEVGCALSLPAQ